MLSLSSLDRVDPVSWASQSGEMLARREGWAYHTSLAGRLEPHPLLIERRLTAHTVRELSQLLSAILIRFFTFFLTRNTVNAVETVLAFLYFFRHLLGCVKKLFLPSKYYTGGVLQIPSDGDDPWKLKSTPKKNEYFEYFNKFTAKKGLSQKILERKISNQEKNILRSSPWLGKTGQSTTPSPIPGENGKFP